MEPNVLLCWLVGLSTGVNALALYLLHRFKTPSWFVVYAMNALLLGAGLLFVPDAAGYASAFIFVLTVMAPIWLTRGAGYAVARFHHGLALKLLRVAALLHPFGLFKQDIQSLEVLAAIDRGEDQRARALLSSVTGPPADAARMQLFRMDSDYQGMLAFIESDARLLLDPAHTPAYVRAQAETGAMDGAIATLQKMQGYLPTHKAAAELFVAALSGREGFVDALLASAFAHYPEAAKRYWRATAKIANGRPAPELDRPAPPAFRAAMADRKRRGVPAFTLSHEQDAWLAQRETIAHARASSEQRGWRRFVTVSGALVIANLLVFALEIPGGVLDDQNLINLGALMLPMHSVNEAWRLFTSCFLHWGWLHLLLNMSSLTLFGPTLERALGKWRFLILYLGAGVTSMGAYALAAWLRTDGKINIYRGADIVVGASGCIMGVIGGLFGLAIAAYWKTRDRPRIVHIVVLGIIVLAQTLFDYFTPQIAMGVHLSGVVVGLLLALALRRVAGIN